MKTVECQLHPQEDHLHPTTRAIRSCPVVERLSIEFLSFYRRNTVLYTVRGDREALATALDPCDSCLSADIGAGPVESNTFHAKLELADQPTASFLEQLSNVRVIVDTPIVATEGASIRASLIGPDEQIRIACETLTDIAHLDILRCQPSYSPSSPSSSDTDPEQALAALSDRQLECLTAAVENGYYHSPKDISSSELASSLDCSRSVVLEHLHRAESKLMDAVEV